MQCQQANEKLPYSKGPDFRKNLIWVARTHEDVVRGGMLAATSAGLHPVISSSCDLYPTNEKLR